MSEKVGTPSGKKKRSFLFRFLSISILVSSLALFSTGVLLKAGIHLDTLSFGRVNISGFSLVWKKKLELQVASLKITDTSTGEDSTGWLKGLKTIPKFAKYFSQFTINTITAHDFTGSLHCTESTSQKSFFNLLSKELWFTSDLTFNDQTLTVDITDFFITRFNSRVSGNIRLDIHKNIVTGNLLANVADSLPVSLSFTADQNTISFQGKETAKINTIKPVVDLFGLDEDIQRWITAYLSGSRYTLTSFSGQFPWDDPMVILDTLQAEIRIDDCEYTFAPGLEPIKAEYTHVIFAKGVLAITPHNSRFYGQGGETSWLDIDFNTPEDIVLTAYITTHARENDDIVRLLDYYGITLPFTQVEGLTDTNLTLTIHLNESRVEAIGKFVIDDGVINYNGELLDVSRALITLQDSAVTIEELDVSYNTLFTASIGGNFDSVQGAGTLGIVINELHIPVGESLLTLQKDTPKPTIDYTISPEGNSFTTSLSTLDFDTVEVLIAPFTSPFSYHDFSGVIPPTLVTSPLGIQTEISGSFSLQQQQADLLCNLLRYDVDNLMLDGQLPLAIRFDRKLKIKADEKSKWSRNNTSIVLHPFELSYGSNVISWQTDKVLYGDIFAGAISATYDYLAGHGDLFLENLQLQSYDIGDIYGEITSQAEKLFIHFGELDTKIAINIEENISWTATLENLAALHNRSTLLQKYHLNAGSLTISSGTGKNSYNFSASLPYTVPILFLANTPLNSFYIVGNSTGDTFSATVNEYLNIHYSDDHLTISSETIGFNVPEIITLLQGNSPEQSNTEPKTLRKESNLTVSLEAQNSFLYIAPGSKALADSVQLEYNNGRASIELLHGPGRIILDSVGNQFTLEGKNLNDEFMGALAQNATLENGKMTMVAQGTFDHFSALVKVQNTLVKEHTTFNNIMGFLNTVPALVTFSSPEYSTRGVLLTSVIAGAMIDDGVATLKSLAVESPLFNLTGTGWVNFPKKLIDMDINLTTQAKTNIRKIPLIGYIIAGEKKRPSVSLEVTGDLLDPDVSNPIFREVATLPFSMLYRTLKLPLNLVNELGD